MMTDARLADVAAAVAGADESLLERASVAPVASSTSATTRERATSDLLSFIVTPCSVPLPLTPGGPPILV